MKAMVLAAGLGTRLLPLTEDRPKALVEVGGRPLLEIVLRRLRAAGVDAAIVNAHHHAEMIAAYLDAHDFGMRIEVSREDELLDTGGGLKKAAWFFVEDEPSEPFLVHNVDVLSSIDLGQMLGAHRESGALATLAVKQRPTSRPLLFDEDCQLCGRGAVRNDPEDLVRPATGLHSVGFCGIHVLSPRIFAALSEEGAFSIVNAYLRLAGEGEKITACCANDRYWRDLGRPEHLAQAEQDIASGVYSFD